MTGAGNAEKDTLPQAVEWGEAGKSSGGPRFRGPVRPVTNSKDERGEPERKVLFFADEESHRVYYMRRTPSRGSQQYVSMWDAPLDW